MRSRESISLDNIARVSNVFRANTFVKTSKAFCNLIINLIRYYTKEGLGINVGMFIQTGACVCSADLNPCCICLTMFSSSINVCITGSCRCGVDWSFLVWDFMQCRLVVSNVSGQPNGPIIKGHQS